MRFGDIIGFRKELFFEGAVQADWFYQQEKAALVAKSFVFHGSEYYGADNTSSSQKYTDTITFTRDMALKAFEEQPSNNLTLAIAGYGTGKSHLAVTLATLLSGKDYQPEVYRQVLDNIRAIDGKATKEISEYTSQPNLVLVLNGMKDFNLHYELLKAAQKSLKLYGCDDTNLKKLNRAIETAFRFFERNAESMTPAFEKFAPQFGYYDKGAQLIERIRKNLGEDEAAFNIINAVYEDFNGHAIRWDEGVSATAILENLESEYCGISGPFNKIIIIFDEFGRYLEYASSTATAHSGDSALQQIFECAQNFGGNLQIINFIQSDIKTYLQRVDQSTNISRYIGRYEGSEKYRLSSNLETVFANLIQRKDKTAFEETVVAWQKSNESLWTATFNSLNRWIATSGIWRNQALFRKVAVEGIYPLHPLSTYMLSKLSDYLQNRSSLMLLSHYIDTLSDSCLQAGGQIPIVMPADLLEGDLFTEMLSAEEEGRQVSQHCIRFNNVLRKYEDKLTPSSIKILRANLALRILRCRTSNYEDAITGLALFSGLSEETVKDEMGLLENEYAVIGYDEHAACFDFLEDSSGAHDFKTYFRRLRSNVKFNTSILEDPQIRRFAEVIEPQVTNFSTNHKIVTNEWQFDQELFAVEDLSKRYLEQCIIDWKSAITSDRSKGRLIWLYTNNETAEGTIDKACTFAGSVSDMPIVLMQLDDNEGLLENALCDYLTLAQMQDKDREKYGRHYLDKLQQTENNISQTLDKLKKARLQFTADGITALQNRLAVALTDVFERIYPAAVPFDFDGFASKTPGKARKAFCSIVRLVLSGQVSESTIHSFPADVRNRFEATLYTASANSWKVINTDYQIIPPANKAALSAYNVIVNTLPEGSELNLGTVIRTLSAPPFGMNDYEAVYMITTVMANLSYCLRVIYKDISYNIANWKEQVIGDNKIELNIIRDSTLKRINAGAVTDQFLSLFNRINSNDNTDMILQLEEELNAMTRVENVPEALAAQHQLAKNKIQEGRRIQRLWENAKEAALKYYDKFLEKRDVYAGMQCIKAFKGYDFYRCFAETTYIMSEDQMKYLQDQVSVIQRMIEPFIDGWLKDQHCASVDQIGSFRSYMKRVNDLFEELGYIKAAQFGRDYAEKELANSEAIRERQELKRNYQVFISEANPAASTPYTKLLEWQKTGTDIINGLEKNKDFLGSSVKSMLTNMQNHLTEIEAIINTVKDSMNKIYNDLYEISTIDDVSRLIANIKRLSLRGIPEKDMSDFDEIEKALSDFEDDVEVMMEEQGNRNRFSENYAVLQQKYENADLEFDVLSVLESVAASVQNTLDEKDNVWAIKHLGDVSDDIKVLHEWLQDTEILPTYLKEETKAAYERKHVEVQKKMSKAKVKSIVASFEALSDKEKEECYALLAKFFVK